MSPTTLQVRDLRVTYGDQPLVEVDLLRVVAGRPLTIVGESGSGKSVLAHALMGTLPPELVAEGTLELDEVVHDLADRGGRRALWGRTLAMLPQEPVLALDPTMRVGTLVAETVPGSRSDARRTAHEALARLGLGHTASSYPYTLSGGMAQRVAYAAATVAGAGVLVVDEPSKGLDQPTVDRLGDLLGEHGARGLLVTITHDLRLARRLGGDVVVMRESSIVERGAAAEVLTSPREEYTRRLLAAEPASWAAAGGPIGRGSHGGAQAVVTATGVAKSYGTTALFDDVTLEIRPDERWAVVGPSGVGKTTLGDVLLGLTPPDRGTVRHAPGLHPAALQKLYQDPALSFPARVTLGAAMRDVVARHRVRPSRVPELMENLGLPASLLQRRPGQVSGGELQRLAIVRAMVVSPSLVFADEATSRLDLLTQQMTIEALLTVLAETSSALLMVTHDHDLAAAVADHRLDLTRTVDATERTLAAAAV